MGKTRQFWLSILAVSTVAFGQGTALGQGQTGAEQPPEGTPAAPESGEASAPPVAKPGQMGEQQGAPSPHTALQESAANGQRAGRAASDASIATGVMQKLTGAGLTPLLTVKVVNSLVTLEGYVPDEDARKRAIDLAVSSPGVTGVVSRLTVRGTQEVLPGVSSPEGVKQPPRGP